MISKLIFGFMLLTWAVITQAQELRCTQVFMNASEKRICATPALMNLDQQIGELGRRAVLHQDGFKSDQRKFRKALKTCDGDESCLTISYQNRISELQAFVATLPPPSDEEKEKLSKAGAKAEAKRDAQAHTREEITAKLSEQDGEEQVEPVAEQATIEEHIPVDATSIDAAPAELAAREVAPQEAPEASTQAVPKESDELGVGWITFLVVLFLGALAGFKSWLDKAVRRCPSCKKWWAGKVIDSDREAYTDYKTRTFEDVHRDKNFAVTGRTTRQRQVKVRVVETTNYYQCIHCSHKWAWTSTSRSS